MSRLLLLSVLSQTNDVWYAISGSSHPLQFSFRPARVHVENHSAGVTEFVDDEADDPQGRSQVVLCGFGLHTVNSH